MVSRKLSENKVSKNEAKDVSLVFFLIYFFWLELQPLRAPGNVYLARLAALEQILGFDGMCDNSAEDLCHLIIALIFVSPNKQA